MTGGLQQQGHKVSLRMCVPLLPCSNTHNSILMVSGPLPQQQVDSKAACGTAAHYLECCSWKVTQQWCDALML